MEFSAENQLQAVQQSGTPINQPSVSPSPKKITQQIRFFAILLVITVVNSVLFSYPLTLLYITILGPLYLFLIGPIMILISWVLTFPLLIVPMLFPFIGGASLLMEIVYLYLLASLLTGMIEKLNKVRQYLYYSYPYLPVLVKTLITFSQSIWKYKKVLILLPIVLWLSWLGLMVMTNLPLLSVNTLQSNLFTIILPLLSILLVVATLLIIGVTKKNKLLTIFSSVIIGLVVISSVTLVSVYLLTGTLPFLVKFPPDTYQPELILAKGDLYGRSLDPIYVNGKEGFLAGESGIKIDFKNNSNQTDLIDIQTGKVVTLDIYQPSIGVTAQNQILLLDDRGKKAFLISSDLQNIQPVDLLTAKAIPFTDRDHYRLSIYDGYPLEAFLGTEQFQFPLIHGEQIGLKYEISEGHFCLTNTSCGGYGSYKLSVYDQTGQEVGSINRRSIEIVSINPIKGELYLITEKGIEKVVL